MNNRNDRSNRKFWIWGIGSLLLLVGLWHLVMNDYREEEKQLRRQLRESVIENFPDQSSKFFQTFGLSYFSTDGKHPEASHRSRKSVVLVHGLDDPGKVWQNLAPALINEKYHVWQMLYPNDQPVVDSARLFYAELKRIRQDGIRRISIVAHSMGGLVSREMLTSPDIAYEKAATDGQVPEVVSLTMVGTPNHGSQLARFRVFAEVRDHLARLQKGEASWLGAVLDGAGEAKIDLLPGSRFLTELNARPQPSGVDQMVIAGITSPWDERDIRAWMARWNQRGSEDRRKQVDALGNYMISMTHGLGDGLVSVESTRMDGVPHRTVAGTHLSIIRNVSTTSRRTPPAVPVIVERLRSEE